MNELLDNEKQPSPEASFEEIVNTIIFIGVMLPGGFGFFYIISPTFDFWDACFQSVALMFFAIFINLIVFLFNNLRKKNQKASYNKGKEPPVWFQLIKGGFLCWCFIFLVTVLAIVFTE